MSTNPGRGMWARIRLDLLGGSYGLLVGLTTALGTACVPLDWRLSRPGRNIDFGKSAARDQLPRPTLRPAKNHRPQSHVIANTLGWSGTGLFGSGSTAGCSRAP